MNVNPGPNAIKNAIDGANPGDTLNLSPGTYTEHDLVIDKKLTITGPATSNEPTAIIDANNQGRVFQVNSGITVNMKYLLLENGFTLQDYGGGILNNGGTVSITSCKFYKNYADMYGGGIANVGGTVKVTSSKLFLNNALTKGGGIYNQNGNLTVYNSYIEGCSAGKGGGIFNEPSGTMKLNDSKFFENQATSYGGAIANYNTMTVTYCDFQINSAVYGQDIYNQGGTTSNRILHYNRLLDADVIYCENGSINAEYNWYGSNSSPSAKIHGNVDYTPWITDIEGTTPKFLSSSPANGATKVAPSKTIAITYNEFIRKGSSFWVELKNNAGAAIPFTNYVSGKVLYINPTSDLAESQYTLSIHTGSIIDMRGYSAAAKSIKFSVGSPPTVKSSNPSNGATNVARNKTITVTFSENIKAGSNFWIELISSSGTKVTITKSISGKVLTIKHSALLKAKTKYYLKLHTGCVTDYANNKLAAKTLSFTTGSS